MSDSNKPAADERQCHGSCHCGRVRFTVRTPAQPTLHACNCSICERLGYLHLIVPAAAFTLQQGREELTEYRFNTGEAVHWFCRHCGVKAFYIPRSHPDGYSVNGRCIDQPDWREWPVQPFDGRHWEQMVAELRTVTSGENP